MIQGEIIDTWKTCIHILHSMPAKKRGFFSVPWGVICQRNKADFYLVSILVCTSTKSSIFGLLCSCMEEIISWVFWLEDIYKKFTNCEFWDFYQNDFFLGIPFFVTSSFFPRLDFFLFFGILLVIEFNIARYKSVDFLD